MTATSLEKNNNVRFAADLCSYHEGAVLDMEYVQEDDVYFPMSEIKYIKHQALKLSHGNNSTHLCSILSSTYGRCSSNVIDAINAWVASCESLRGLERFVNQDYREKRTCARLRTIEVVLTAQRKMRKDGVKDSEYVEMVLGRLSEAFSQDYVRFAAVLGQADMLAVSFTDDADGVVSDFGDCQKITPKIILPHDVTRSRSPFPVAKKKSPPKPQRDFMEMRFCF